MRPAHRQRCAAVAESRSARIANNCEGPLFSLGNLTQRRRKDLPPQRQITAAVTLHAKPSHSVQPPLVENREIHRLENARILCWDGQWAARLVLPELPTQFQASKHPLVSRFYEHQDTSHQENLESDSMQLCAMEALWRTFVRSIHFQAVRSDSTRALSHECTSKHSPKVFSSVSLSRFVLIPSTRVIHYT